MVLNNIEQLLEKYDNGETSLNEEQQLRDYFAQEEVAPHLESYKVMFQYFNTTKQEHYTKDVPLKPKKTYTYQWISVAAAIVLLFGFFFNQNREKQEALLAYNQTMEAFNLVSSQFNKGTQAMQIISSNIDKGKEGIAQLGEFSNTTNKIFKNK